ncbi:hypothetical protein KR215_000557 [Drosophila sulfurigaster]|uniref:uncharacterized protein LOC133847421 n=1 Tax=Drosophila sulfurigaster albostrigata TaxID=89887 RepID=UPI002D21AB26|nr:uncharacterized protein LOC133847421 [Drosophila sulfurigaster albostrigata]KAH8411218.1 hypothetical protein KR215_000557 [Drosophila sulfurigaster]
MLKRNLQSIQLTLADLEEYENVRRRNKTKAAIEAGRCSSVTVTATETAPSTTSDSTSETGITQEQRPERSNVPGWTTATIADSNTNSGSTEDDTSVQAVVDDNDTIAELSDDGWVDIDEEDEEEELEGAVGGEI